PTVSKSNPEPINPWYLLSTVIYRLDAANVEELEASKNGLHSWVEEPQLLGLLGLVLGNKRDLPSALDEKQLIKKLETPEISAKKNKVLCLYMKELAYGKMKKSRIEEV
uniref:Uncharacterized protein n=1 Tax=Ornithorhynchus anatinus TaxID=9258 RepID=A0A6I8P186_ORNAN